MVSGLCPLLSRHCEHLGILGWLLSQSCRVSAGRLFMRRGALFACLPPVYWSLSLNSYIKDNALACDMSKDACLLRITLHIWTFAIPTGPDYPGYGQWPRRVNVHEIPYDHTFNWNIINKRKKRTKYITRDIEIKNIVTIARGVWEGVSGERGL